jgi:hypothetical protein
MDVEVQEEPDGFTIHTKASRLLLTDAMARLKSDSKLLGFEGSVEALEMCM